MSRPGFTLIELLVAISVMAVLSGIVMTNFAGSQRRGWDVRRQSDLNQYRVALENYATTNSGVYPSSAANGSAQAQTGIFSSSGILANYLTGWPTDPHGYDYYYRATASGLDWTLRGCMESNNQKLVYEVCANGKTGSVTGSNCANLASLGATCSL